MDKSIYFEAFKESKGTFKLFGSKLLVEKVDAGEIKSKGGIILSAPTGSRSNVKSMEPLVCVVLAAGEGYTNDEGGSVPLSVVPGNIIITNANGVSFFSTLPGVPNYSEMKVGITTESDVQMVFESAAQFEEYVNIIGKVK